MPHYSVRDSDTPNPVAPRVAIAQVEPVYLDAKASLGLHVSSRMRNEQAAVGGPACSRFYCKSLSSRADIFSDGTSLTSRTSIPALPEHNHMRNVAR